MARFFFINMLPTLLLINTTLMALPVPPPDLTQCQPAMRDDQKTTLSCCLPVSYNNNNKIIDFVAPSYSALRVRPAAHLVDEAYLAKYERAVELMKALGPDHPWNHMQQANVHCAYCNGAYNMPGYNVPIQVHFSWLFFPFHRLYTYFHERILGRLIGDDTFAVPFWNWDSPDGMTMPRIYTNAASPLYDPLRNPSHQPPKIVDFHYYGVEAPETVNLTDRNLRTMHRQMASASTAELFLGSRYVAGMEAFSGGGIVQYGPHAGIHAWTGNQAQPNWEDLGSIYAAARDPLFFPHHANLDRLWHLWPTLPGGSRRAFQDEDWLDSSFVFWDENLQLVRVRVRDCLDTLRLGYTYQEVPLPWIDYRPSAPPEQVKSFKKDELVTTSGPLMMFPVRLKSTVIVEIERPLLGDHKEEVLMIGSIELMTGADERDQLVKFDVYVNAQGSAVESTGPESAHFAGSFVRLPTGMGMQPRRMKTRLLLEITELLKEIGADRDDNILVSLVPRKGCDNVTVGDVSICAGTCGFGSDSDTHQYIADS